MAQQTAVEWLVEQLENVDYNPLEKGGYDTAKKRIIEHAKAMEKEQLIGLLEWMNKVTAGKTKGTRIICLHCGENKFIEDKL